MKITNSEHIQNKFLIGRSLFLGGGISLLLAYGSKDTWIGMILGFLLGIGIIYLYSKVSFSASIHDYLQKKSFINITLKLTILLFSLFVMFFLLSAFSIFIYSFYLPFTPTLISVLPFLFLAIFLGSKGKKSISKVAKILFFTNLVLIGLKFTMLGPNIKIDNFLPVYTISKSNLFLTAVTFAILSTTPYLLMVDVKCDFKTNLKSYTLNSGILILMIIYLIGCLGTNLAKTFSYPEFSILRQINIFDFIQNIESFLAMNWAFDIFIALSYASEKIKEVCSFKNNLFSYLIGLVLLILVCKLIISDYIGSLILYKNFILIFLILSLVIYLFLGIKKRSTKSNAKCK